VALLLYRALWRNGIFAEKCVFKAWIFAEKCVKFVRKILEKCGKQSKISLKIKEKCDAACGV